MINRDYREKFSGTYREELDRLQELGAEFSRNHPKLAPMLSTTGVDPDVDRLLQGVAFLTALLRQKLDDEFPEVIHDLMRLIWPHYLRPIPSTAIIAFSPKPTLKQTLVVPAGVHIASGPVEVERTSCLFQTSYPMEIHPLSLLDSSFAQPPGQPPGVKVLLELKGPKLSDWQPQALRFFLGGDFAGATDLYFLLCRHLKSIVITPLEKGSPAVLPKESLKPVGFARGEELMPYPALLPYPTHSFPGYRILQEYIIAPEKFLFLDLVGWDRWEERGEGTRFEVRFELEDLPFPPRIKKDSFVLFATPAANLFPHEADPINLDHRKTEYLVRPSGANSRHYQVYSVDKVSGFVQGTAQERPYVPFEVFNPEPGLVPVYRTSLRASPLGEGFDVFLSVDYPPKGAPPASETLSIHLTCTNGSLPESLRPGDVNRPTGSSPEFVEFKNLQSPTANILPPLGRNLLWRLLSHLSLNYLSLSRPENLRALLGVYLFPESRDRPAALANQKKISGIVDLEAKGSNRLISGVMMRGQQVQLKLRQDHFASPGDLFLFGCVLDQFIGGYASINSFTQLIIQEVVKGDLYSWPARLGNHPLI